MRGSLIETMIVAVALITCGCFTEVPKAFPHNPSAPPVAPPGATCSFPISYSGNTSTGAAIGVVGASPPVQEAAGDFSSMFIHIGSNVRRVTGELSWVSTSSPSQALKVRILQYRENGSLVADQATAGGSPLHFDVATDESDVENVGIDISNRVFVQGPDSFAEADEPQPFTLSAQATFSCVQTPGHGASSLNWSGETDQHVCAAVSTNDCVPQLGTTTRNKEINVSGAVALIGNISWHSDGRTALNAGLAAYNDTSKTWFFPSRQFELGSQLGVIPFYWNLSAFPGSRALFIVDASGTDDPSNIISVSHSVSFNVSGAALYINADRQA